MIHVKVCCIASVEEAHAAVAAGASALGLVSRMPSGPGVIPDELIAEIAAAVPPPTARFLLTCAQDADEIVEQSRRAGVDTVQICDRVPGGVRSAVRRALPGLRVVQVVHVTGPESVEEARDAARDAHALLLDSGSLQKVVKELGGTGRRHDWDVSRRIVETAGVPVFLAGGLRPENVAEAVARVQPWGLDVCTGVRTDGRLDPAKARTLIQAARLPG
jgi:phosphoribosylanthranilate isomerase